VHFLKGRLNIIVSFLKDRGAMVYVPGKFHVEYRYVREWLRDLDPF